MCAFAVGKNRRILEILKTQLSLKKTGGSSLHHFEDCVQQLLKNAAGLFVRVRRVWGATCSDGFMFLDQSC